MSPDHTNHSFQAIPCRRLPSLLRRCRVWHWLFATRWRRIASWWTPGFPLDGSRIRRQFALNLVDGNGFTYCTGFFLVSVLDGPALDAAVALGYPLLGGAVAAASILGVILSGCHRIFRYPPGCRRWPRPWHLPASLVPDWSLTRDGRCRRLWHGSASGRAVGHGGLAAAFCLSGSGQAPASAVALLALAVLARPQKHWLSWQSRSGPSWSVAARCGRGRAARHRWPPSPAPPSRPRRSSDRLSTARTL